jgi:hypothetical protein
MTAKVNSTFSRSVVGQSGTFTATREIPGTSWRDCPPRRHCVFGQETGDCMAPNVATPTSDEDSCSSVSMLLCFDR